MQNINGNIRSTSRGRRCGSSTRICTPAASSCARTRPSTWCGGTRSRHEVYQERLSRVFYENYVGSIIDWYAATLMRREPVLLFEGNDAGGEELLQPAVGRLRPEGHEPAASSSGSDSCRRWCAAAVTSWWTFRGRRAGADAGGGGCAGQIAGVPGGLQRRTRSSTGATTETGGLEWV